MAPQVTTTPQGTDVNGTFYQNLGSSDSAFPSAAPAPTDVPQPTNNVVVTAGQAQSQFNQHSNDLQGMLNQLGGVNSPNQPKDPTLENSANDPYMQMLTKIGNQSDASTKALISTIQAQRANEGNTINEQYDNYKRGLQLLGIQQNSAQSSPDLLMGHIQQAENQHRAKIQALDVEMNKALMDAEQARSEKNLSVLKEKMDYVKQLKQERNDYLKNIADQMGYQTKIAENQAGMFYDQLQKLNDADKEDFLIALSKKYNLPLAALTKAVADERERRIDSGIERQNKQRIASGSSSSGGGYTASELKKLRQAGIDSTNTKKADNFLYGENKGVVPPTFSSDNIKEFGKGKLWDLALSLGIERDKNLTREDEINKMFEDEDFVDYVQSMLDEGNTIDDIIAAQE